MYIFRFPLSFILILFYSFVLCESKKRKKKRPHPNLGAKELLNRHFTCKCMVIACEQVLPNANYRQLFVVFQNSPWARWFRALLLVMRAYRGNVCISSCKSRLLHQIFRSIIERYIAKLNIPNIFHYLLYQIKFFWAEKTHLEGHTNRRRVSIKKMDATYTTVTNSLISPSGTQIKFADRVPPT